MPNYIFPKLTNNEQFEYMIIDLFQAKYPDTKVEKYGRQGQKQYGIDITIQGTIEGKQQLWCIQCKNYDKLTTSDVDLLLKECTFYTEVKPFAKLIIATFAPNDTNIVKHLLEIRASGKYPFDIEYVPQNVICDYIENTPSVFEKYYGRLLPSDTLKQGCIEILKEYEIEAFLRIDPLTEGMSKNLPDIIEECCFKLQVLLDENLIRRGDHLYNLVTELHDWLDSYNSSLSLMLFPQVYTTESNEHLTRFIYLPPENGIDVRYQEKVEAVLEYRKYLIEFINAIATYIPKVMS